MASPVELRRVPLPGTPDIIAELRLMRPEVSNAFNGVMIEAFLGHFAALRAEAHRVRAVVVRGEGKHFSAGADLDWMRASSALSLEANRAEAGRLSALFEGLYELPMPVVGVIHGAAFGGGVGLAACCDYVLAAESAKFCLSEVKLGLVAAVILPYLAVRVRPGDLRRFVLTASVFGAAEAKEAGLVQRVCPPEGLEGALREELGLILAGEPSIQRTFKRNHRAILERDLATWKGYAQVGIETIAQARVSETGQEGIQAFLGKRAPKWRVELPADWKP